MKTGREACIQSDPTYYIPDLAMLQLSRQQYHGITFKNNETTKQEIERLIAGHDLTLLN